MSTKLLTENYKLHIANQLIESVSEVANTAYYLYVGNHVPYANSVVPTANNNQRSVYIDAYRNMVMGKRVGVNDITLMIKNTPYVSNTVYAMYDDSDPNISSKNYFVVVNEGAYFHVYKCLDNNGNTVSTVEPEFTHISGANTSIYQTSDGYRWKYMYSASSSQNQKFATTEYFPVFANTVVADQAVSGAIDVIKVESAGRGYDNFTSGVFATSDLKYNGISTLYEISNTSASTINGFYEGCIIYITNGPGAGAYRKINSYTIQSGRKIISIDSPFDVDDPPLAGSVFQINPEVRVYGDGSETINAVARALVNASAGNTVYRIEMLNRGKDYRYATANVIANSVVLVDRNAVIRPIYSPAGGHGKNQAAELNASRVCISVKFANNESNTILTTNQFQQIGLLKDPLFNNVRIDHSSIVGSFISGERVYKITPVQLVTNAVSNTTKNIISSTVANFTSQLSVGDFIYLKASDESEHQLTNVTEVTNATHIKISSNAYFSCSGVIVYQGNVSTTGIVTDVETGYVTISNVSGTISTGDVFIGLGSGAQMVANTTTRNNKIKNFNTFIQLNKYEATATGGTFTPNELVYQGTSFNLQLANASLHSVINTGGSSIEIYTSNQVGDFIEGDVVTGATSNALALVNTVYQPELVFGSGDILYFENVEPVTRTANESENFKVILEF